MGRRKRKRNINVRKNTIVEVGATIGSMEVETDTTVTRAVFKSSKGEDLQKFTKRVKNTRPSQSREFIDWESPVIQDFEFFFKDSYIVDDGFVVPRQVIIDAMPGALYDAKSDLLDDWAHENFKMKRSLYQYKRESYFKTVKPKFQKFLKDNLDDDFYNAAYPIVMRHLERMKGDPFTDFLTDMEFELIELQRDADINIDGMSFRGKDGLWPIENFFDDISATINRAVYQKVKVMEEMIDDYNNGVANKYGHTNKDMTLEEYMGEVFEYMRWMVDSISSVIKQLPGLPEDIMLFRGGPFDETLEVGEISEFSSPTSFSFKRDVAEAYADRGNWLYVVYAPERSKLAAVNHASRFKGYHYSAGEVFNMAHQKYVVLEKDVKNHIVTILLLNEGDQYRSRRGQPYAKS